MHESSDNNGDDGDDAHSGGSQTAGRVHVSPDGEEAQQPAAPASIADEMPSGTLEQIDDDAGPPPPASAIEATLDRAPKGRPELVVDDDADGPLPPGMIEAALDQATKGTEGGQDRRLSGGLELPNDEEDEGPPLQVEMGGDSFAESEKEKLKLGEIERIHPPPTAEEDSILVPSREEMESATPTNHHPSATLDSARIGPASLGSDGPQGENRDQDDAATIPIIPEAYLVEETGEDGTIIDAQLLVLIPWWKQKRTRILFAAVFLILVAAAIAVGVSFSMDPAVLPGPEPTPAFPSMQPSHSPSSSFAPSSAPTSCSAKISASAQHIDLRREVENPLDPDLAVNGPNMVVVTKDARSVDSVKVTFYALTEEGWVRTNTLSEEIYYEQYSVAVSGRHAFVGIPSADNDSGTLFVYEQDEFGIWERKGDPLIPKDEDALQGDTRYGEAIGMDGDLACVSGYYATFIFVRRDDRQWVELEMLEGHGGLQCLVAGNTIFIENWGSVSMWKYNQELDSVETMQDSITADNWSAGPADLSGDYLVFSKPETVLIYRLDESNQTYALVQELHSSDFNVDSDDEDRHHQVALDKDILVIGGYNNTHIYSEQNGLWQESIILEETYDRYQLSDRNLLLTTSTWNGDTRFSEVYFIRLEACTQPMPTQVPSVSPAPTICYIIDIEIAYDGRGYQTSWKLHRVDRSGDTFEIYSYYETDGGATSYAESICVQEATYEFTIFDQWGDGISPPGYYNVTTNEKTIASGGDFGYRETTRFALPFAEGPFSVFQIPTTSPTN